MRQFYLIFVILIFGCTSNKNSNNQTLVEKYEFNIKNLTDEAYPDNPDIGFRSENYDFEFFKSGYIQPDDSIFHLAFYSKNNDSIILAINFMEFIPTIPKHLKNDEYLTYLSLINQEWNRNQVKFLPPTFTTNLNKIARVDIARNCLNAYLWEIIVYVNENNSLIPYAHGWFDFPKALYKKLFELKNGSSFEKYRIPLENWVDPDSKKIASEMLRTVIDTINISFEDLSNEMYPLKRTRLKKRKEIIYPISFSSMKNLQTDSTLFATFSPPGFYNKKDPRKTQLGRFYHLIDIRLNKIISKANNDTLIELKLSFWDKEHKRKTHLIIGGINFNDLPVLSNEDANDGWKNAMGFSNHTFYEDYHHHLNHKTFTNPYYAYLTDENGNWLDSHSIGIDGPLMYFSNKEKTNLHLWLLSFERHAFVGHYQINIKS